MNEAAIDVVGAEELDYDAYALFQIESYAELLNDADVSNSFMTPAFYRWKYSPPAGMAKIAIVREGKDIVAANAMFPLQLYYNGEFAHGWQSCDTATCPRARGQGYFQRCLYGLMDMLPENSVFFGFPNRNSMRGFEKIGWKVLHTVRTYVNPATLTFSGIDTRITRTTRFSEAHDVLAQELATLGNASVLRAADYLNWRYVDHPLNEYTCFMYEESGVSRGYAVVRRARALGSELAVVMELWGLDPSIERKLLHSAALWAREQKLLRMVLLDTALHVTTAWRNGFIPVPAFVLPKRQLLMASATPGRVSTAMLNGRWRVQMGDWDAF